MLTQKELKYECIYGISRQDQGKSAFVIFDFSTAECFLFFKIDCLLSMRKSNVSDSAVVCDGVVNRR